MLLVSCTGWSLVCGDHVYRNGWALLLPWLLVVYIISFFFSTITSTTVQLSGSLLSFTWTNGLPCTTLPKLTHPHFRILTNGTAAVTWSHTVEYKLLYCLCILVYASVHLSSCRSEAFQSFVSRCLQKDPEDRPTADGALEVQCTLCHVLTLDILLTSK